MYSKRQQERSSGRVLWPDRSVIWEPGAGVVQIPLWFIYLYADNSICMIAFLSFICETRKSNKMFM